MATPSQSPLKPEEQLWDVVVVGTGMGGSTLGLHLAKQGHQVLFIEKGLWLFGVHDRWGCESRSASMERFCVGSGLINNLLGKRSGINPSLTIGANAIRVAEVIGRQLSAFSPDSTASSG